MRSLLGEIKLSFEIPAKKSAPFRLHLVLASFEVVIVHCGTISVQESRVVP